MVFSAFIINFFSNGASEIATAFQLNKSFSDILIGIIVFFIIGCEFFINYKIVFRHKRTNDGAPREIKVDPKEGGLK